MNPAIAGLEESHEHQAGKQLVLMMEHNRQASQVKSGERETFLQNKTDWFVYRATILATVEENTSKNSQPCHAWLP